MEPCPSSVAPARGLARDRELVRAALQKIKDWPRRHRQSASATGRAAGVAFKANARSEFAQDRSGLFGNERARPARSDEGRRNNFPGRIGCGPSRQAQRVGAQIILLSVIPTEVEGPLTISVDLSPSAPEISRDVSASLDMTNRRCAAIFSYAN